LSSRLLSENLKIKIYKTKFYLLFVWNENWSLTLTEENKLSVFENKVLRRIFGPKREEVAGDLRRLRNEELYNMYACPTIIRLIK